ncbi:hypothetical protein ILUMI_22220 [Ignelater luminosus]|uniref:Uncharacterized protein n=1 Tax=Ignelater luminosus TaxID=2038154 RepID=A0A8K0G0R2_IGNLU|nr:hypothetical protein ILUMI_22220 [Ignelater luminosus]
MEVRQSNSNAVIGQRTIIVKELIQHPSSDTAYISRQIITEESYAPAGVPGQCILLKKTNIESGIYLNTNIALVTNEAVYVNAVVNYNNLKRDCDNLTDETPMEVDLNSSREELINTIRNIEEHNLRQRRNEMPNLGNIETSSMLVPIEKPSISAFARHLLILISLIAILGVYMTMGGGHALRVQKKLQIENLKSDLKESLHHQDEALNVIMKNIDRMEYWKEGIKVLPFIGTTGVGKTFTVNIIKKHFVSRFVHEVTNIRDQQKVIDKLQGCFCNLIIVDNLKASDLSSFLGFIENLPKSYDILIIPIFNIHDTTDGVTYHVSEEDFKLIREKFDASNLYYDLVIYDALDYLTIEKWLRKQLYKKDIDECRHDMLVQSILNHDNVKYKGFKGLNLKLLSRLNNN